MVCVDGDGVGIGTTANGRALHVIGDAQISGVVTATTFSGDGSGLINLANDSLFQWSLHNWNWHSSIVCCYWRPVKRWYRNYQTT